MNESRMTALVTGADRGFGLDIARLLLERGMKVYAGKFLPDFTLLESLLEEYPETLRIVPLDISDTEDMKKVRDIIDREDGALDLLVSNAALLADPPGEIPGQTENYDFDMMERYYRVNAVTAPLLTETMLPLLRKGTLKRLWFTSSEVSSVHLMRRQDTMRYSMSKTALNLSVRMLFNTLRGEGFTFRLYHPGWLKKQLQDGSYSEKAELIPMISAKEAVRQIFEERPDEDRLVLLDYQYQEMPF